MAKAPSSDSIELEPDAWERFERAVKVVVKSAPQHRRKEKKSPLKHKTKKKAT